MSLPSGGVPVRVAHRGLQLIPRWPTVADGKRLIFIRHAEGWHNKDYYEKPNYMEDHLGETEAYWDARLTPEGEKQSWNLAQKMQWRNQAQLVELVAVSPLTRAIQTASIAFPNITVKDATGGEMQRRVPFVATSLARERVWTHQCDRRRPRHVLETEFPHVNFSEIQEGDDDEMWPHKEIDPDPFNSTAVATRGVRFLDWLWQRPEREIAIVSHWVFMRTLLRQFDHKELHADFGNAEMRMVTLIKDEDHATGEHGHDEL